MSWESAHHAKLAPLRTNQAAGGWNEARTAELRTLWAEGLSCSQIAKKIGGITRCSVIGKAHRLGLAGRERPSAPAAARPPRPASILTKRSAPPLTSKPNTFIAREPRGDVMTPGIIRATSATDLPLEGPGSKTILTVGACQCRWPIGDPQSPDFTLCGRSTPATYCVQHARVAYSPKPRPDLARALRRVA